MKVLVVAPGASYSTKDVHDNVRAGLAHAGADVFTYSLHGRLQIADRVQHAAWRARRKANPTEPRPNVGDVIYEATIPIFEKLYRFEPEVVLFVSGVLVTGEVYRLIRKRHTVAVLLTESPYLMEHEIQLARHADIVWTNDRAAVARLQASTPTPVRYLAHAWRPGLSFELTPATQQRDAQVGRERLAAHDVVFVGTDFKERIALLEGVDWTGIDLGLYGNWQSLAADSPLRPFVRGAQVTNEIANALYRRAKIGLNLYRTTTDYSGRPLTHPVESLNPRAYELAAGGVFTLSTPRAEVVEKFGPLVPTFSSSAELSQLLRRWLADDAGRAAIARQLPACVAEDTWLARGRQLLADLRELRARAA